MKITSITQQAKNPNRANISVDGKYLFSLDIFQISNLGIKIGNEYSEVELENLQNESNGELKERQGASQGIVDRVLERLQEKGYVDDEKFANWWVENRHLKKGISHRKLQGELMLKGVDKKIIDKATATYIMRSKQLSEQNKIEIDKILDKIKTFFGDEQYEKFMTSF